MLPTGLAAQSVSPEQSALYLAFVEAASGGDPRLVQVAEQFLKTPPTTIEDIGFYGLADASPEERALRGILSVLASEGHILDLSVKYLLTDFDQTLREADLLGPLRAETNLESALPDGDWSDPAHAVFAASELAIATGPYARAIEAELATRDRELLQITLPLGYAVFYWVPRARVATQWRCVTLFEGPNVLRAGETLNVSVAAMDWAQFYDLIRIRQSDGNTDDFALLDLPSKSCAIPQV